MCLVTSNQPTSTSETSIVANDGRNTVCNEHDTTELAVICSVPTMTTYDQHKSFGPPINSTID